MKNQFIQELGVTLTPEDKEKLDMNSRIIRESLGLYDEWKKVVVCPFVVESMYEPFPVKDANEDPNWRYDIGQAYVDGGTIYVPTYYERFGGERTVDALIFEIARCAYIMYLRKKGIPIGLFCYVRCDEEYLDDAYVKADAYAYAYMISFANLNPANYRNLLHGEFDDGVRARMTSEFRKRFFWDFGA